jgi:hypothetical protein
MPGAFAQDPALGPIALTATPDGYAASVELRRAGQPSQRWVVRQDSRLRLDPD